jgi:hypothetical protein
MKIEIKKKCGRDWNEKGLRKNLDSVDNLTIGEKSLNIIFWVSKTIWILVP